MNERWYPGTLSPEVTEMELQHRKIARRAAAVARDPDYGEIVCHCRQVSRGEIKEAIRRGATTLDGVKRRTGAGMGRCQGARCLLPVLETLAAETGIKIGDVTKDGAGSDLVTAYGEL